MSRQVPGGGPQRMARGLTLLAVLVAVVVVPPARVVGGEAEATGGRIVRVLVRGNVRATTDRILGQMRLHEGSTYSPAADNEDLNRIYSLGEFDNVVLRTEKTPEGLVLVVEVTERPVLERLIFEGNRKFSDKDLTDAVGVNPGSLLDRNKIFQGARAIERKYREGGYYFVKVALDDSLLGASRVAKFAITEGPRVRISKVTFSGNHSIEARELEGKIETRPYFIIFSPGTFDEEQLASDVVAVRNYYIAQGFCDVKVDRELEFTPDKANLTVHVVVEEGPRYKVRSVSLVGAKRFAPSLLEKQMDLKPGAAYTTDAVRHDVEMVGETYGEVGYVDVSVRPTFDFTDEPAMVDVTLKIEEGSVIHVGEIRIEGNQFTQDRVIRRELRFFPEEAVNAKLIEKAKRRLEGTRLFKPGSTQITRLPTANPEVEDILVRVEDTVTGSLIFGAGISSNIGVTGNISLAQRNFDISDWPKSQEEFWRGESFRGAGQSAEIALAPGMKIQQYSVSFGEPHLGGSDYGFFTSAFLFNGNRDSYDERRIGMNFGFGKELSENLRAFTKFRLENININSIDADAPKDVRDVKGSSGLTSVEVGLEKDTTDSLYFPSEGYRLMGSVEQAGAMGGSYTFTKAKVDGRKYWTITKDVLDRRSVLVVRGYAANAFGDPPIFERFFAGGQGSIRGFKYRGVGPHENDTAIGGDFIALASAEYLFPIFDKTLQGVLFLDTGTVEKNISFGSWRSSVGFGVRFTVPFLGPVPFALDFGIPISKKKGDETEVFSFSIGVSF